jgi:radical SAM superfamily enzyme YgiQ (UPF0313 family)
VLFFHDPELIHLVLAVHEQARHILPDAFFCVGSGTAAAEPQFYIERGFDYICGRCGKDIFHSFPRLVREIKKGQAPPRGIYAVPYHFDNLNQFPLIATKYFNDVTPQWCFPSGHIEQFGLILGSLGCTSGCSHCPNSSYWGTTWIPMSADRIFKEIQVQRQLLQVKTFYFGDMNFFPNNNIMTPTNGLHPLAIERVRQLDALLDGYDVDVKFISTVRPDTINKLASKDPHLLDIYLKHFLCCLLGFESFSPDILAGLNRKITREMLRNAVRELEKRNITIAASFLVGSIHETPETLAQTEAFIMEELPSSTIPLLNIMTPFPGTAFHDYIDKHNLLMENDLTRFNGQHMLYRHPVFQQGELEERIQQFYYKYFTERYTG